MPPRRTSPRRTVTRPTVAYEAFEEVQPADSRMQAAAPWIAVVALIVAAVAVGFTLTSRGGDDLAACRSAAWSAIPDPHDLPASWTLGSTDMNANGMTVSVMGPASADGTTAQPVAYASVTCYGSSAASAMRANRDAAEAAGARIVDRAAGGDAYDVIASSGSITTLFRVGNLVGQLADAGTADPADLAKITAAVATAMGDKAAAGKAGPVPSVSASGSDDTGAAGQGCGLASTDPSAGPTAPDLEAKLPTDVAGTPLTRESASADTVFGTDPNGRALAARIRSLGATLADLQLAQACDETHQLDLSIAAFRLPGKDVTKLRETIVETWLSANAAGVKQTQVTLGGKKLIKIDYGDGGALDYVYTGSDYVTVIDTTDPDVATEAASKIK
jgi:hypothetical protein